MWWFIAIACVVVATTGAIETNAVERLELRFLLVVIIFFGVGFFLIFCATAVRWITGGSAFNNFRLACIIAAVGTVPGSVGGRYAAAFFGGYEIEWMMFLRSLVHGGISVAVVLAFIFFIRHSRVSNTEKALDKPKVGDASATIDYPTYIESEDHHLKIVHDTSVELVRATLANFAAELGEAGIRCHRSYWVSRRAVRTTRRRGRQMLLILQDGTEIPVGRSYEKTVRAMLG